MSIEERQPVIAIRIHGQLSARDEGDQTGPCNRDASLVRGLRVQSTLSMTSIGTGYDLSASTYSPDGRIFQVISLPY
jgi:Proteasome subunit A N-terminal signature